MSLWSQDAVVAEAVKRLISGSNTDRAFDAAQMQLINLSEIIRAAGPQWARIKEKIRGGSMNFLRGCLSEDDIVIPAGDGFLIIFATQETPERLKERADELRDMLLEFYLGEEELKRLKIQVGTQHLSTKDLGALVAPPPPPREAQTTSCVFAPMWTPQAGMIASYLCLPAHHGADGQHYGYDAAYAETGVHETRDFCALDLHLLDAVDSALARYRPDVIKPAIAVSVHSTTLQNWQSRVSYLERLAKINAEQRKSMIVKVAEIEPGAPLINLADWAGLLRARVKNVLFEHHHSEAVPPDLSAVGVWGAGYAMSARESADLVAAARQFRRWGDALTRHKLRFFIDNVRQQPLIRPAAEAGARFISSETFWPYQKWPGGVVKAAGPIGGPATPAG